MKQGQGLVTVNEPLPVIALSTQNFDPRTRVQAFETAAASIFKLTAGQSPDPAWQARLERASDKFRALGEKAYR